MHGPYIKSLKKLTSIRTLRRYGKPLVFVVCAYPAAWLFVQMYFAFTHQPHQLGFNIFEFSNRYTGDWALRFILIGLAVTPYGKLIKSFKPLMFRRMLGLYAFFYVCLHISSYLFLDLGANWQEFIEDVIKRTYITLGMLAFAMLIPLAATSFDKAQHWLGIDRWRKIHKMVYIIAPLGVVHFYMMKKAFSWEPVIYGGIYILLMAMRYFPRRAK